MQTPKSPVYLMGGRGESADWVPIFVQLQLKRLHGEPLTDDEAALVASVELLERTLPGSITDAVLEHTPTALRPHVYAVAAASVSSVHAQVLRTIEQKSEYVSLDVGGQTLPVLRIRQDENLVEPIYQEGYRFVVQRLGARSEEVTRLGGIFVGFDELRSMELVYEEATKTIRLSAVSGT